MQALCPSRTLHRPARSTAAWHTPHLRTPFCSPVSRGVMRRNFWTSYARQARLTPCRYSHAPFSGCIFPVALNVTVEALTCIEAILLPWTRRKTPLVYFHAACCLQVRSNLNSL